MEMHSQSVKSTETRDIYQLNGNTETGNSYKPVGSAETLAYIPVGW